MVYELEDTSKAKGLFEGWQEKLITSCLQKVMGRIFVTDLSEPVWLMDTVSLLWSGLTNPQTIETNRKDR